jgi:hypothetical protein
MKNLFVPTLFVGLVFPRGTGCWHPTALMGRTLENLVGFAPALQVFCLRHAELTVIRGKWLIIRGLCGVRKVQDNARKGLTAARK